MPGPGGLGGAWSGRGCLLPGVGRGAWSGGCLLLEGVSAPGGTEGPGSEVSAPGRGLVRRVPGGDPPQTTTAADGTHPTGMHSCCTIKLHKSRNSFLFV